MHIINRDQKDEAVQDKDSISLDVSESADALAFCKAAMNLQKGNEWLEGSAPSSGFISTMGQLPAEKRKERYRKARTMAVKKGWLEHGRRILCGPKKDVIETAHDGDSFDRNYYSLEDYVRLTTKGKGVVAEQSDTVITLEQHLVEEVMVFATTRHNENVSSMGGKTVPMVTSSRVFVKNVPKSANVQQLVTYLERSCACSVWTARIEIRIPWAQFCFARVEMETPEDAAKIISLSKQSQLRLLDRTLEVYNETGSPPKKYTGDPTFYYEKVSKAETHWSKSSSYGTRDRSSEDVSNTMVVEHDLPTIIKSTEVEAEPMDTAVTYDQSLMVLTTTAGKLNPQPRTYDDDTACSDDRSDDCLSFCKDLNKNLRHGEWQRQLNLLLRLDYGKPGVPEHEVKEKVRMKCSTALRHGYLEEGRRIVCGPDKDKIVEVPTNDATLDKNYYSEEAYFRLTAEGALVCWNIV
jgi:hypothetical protein